MESPQVLVIAGTHGNEINAPWLVDQWLKNPDLIKTNDVRVFSVIGNPEALKLGKRYLDRDLNRSFTNQLLGISSFDEYELSRARELLSIYGPNGTNNCQIAIDLHSTTSSMGASLVVYGRRPPDLALAALIQASIGTPVYLHEGDNSQKGFLVESWQCGLVFEVGPVPQLTLQSRIIQQTRILLEVCLKEIERVIAGIANYPDQLVVHRHLGSLDFPRDSNGQIDACIHPSVQGKDWQPITSGTPLFLGIYGDVVRFNGEDGTVPVFINEAAYAEKHIAMSLTKKETWNVALSWGNALRELLMR